MLTILLIFLLLAVVFSGLLYALAQFLQGYFYTQPTRDLWWAAPATGLVMASFLSGWCLLLYFSPESSATSLPYDTLLRFSPRLEMFNEPARELWQKNRDGKLVHYQRSRERTFPVEYIEANNPQRPWARNAQEIYVPFQGDKIRFLPQPWQQGGYREFVSESGEWEMREYADGGPTGVPSSFRMGRFLGNLFLNFLHLVLWGACLYVFLQFNWAETWWMTLILWIAMTLIVMPMLFSTMGGLAQDRRAASGSALIEPGME